MAKKTTTEERAYITSIGNVEAGRVSVNKAYKMYVGGAFVRSESGRYFQVEAPNTKGTADPDVVNIPLGSRKDARDAILVAKSAGDAWAARTAYNRGQILYRLAEVMESRRGELTASLLRAGSTAGEASAEVNLAIDRAVYYAGFCDKISSLVASHNPVSGPHFGFTMPEPMGVVGVVAPDEPALLGLVSILLPIIASGNTVVAIASRRDPRTAVVFSECLATSDLPGGVVNILTGDASEIAPHMAKHREVNAMDVWSDNEAFTTLIEKEGAGSVKRVRTHNARAAASLRDDAGQGIGFIEKFLEFKTVWHPVGV